MGDAHGGHAAGAGREFDRMADPSRMQKSSSKECTCVSREPPAASAQRPNPVFTEPTDRFDQAGACHANPVLEVFRRRPAIRRSHQMVQDFPSRRLYPALSRRATLKKVAATIVTAPSTIRWIAES